MMRVYTSPEEAAGHVGPSAVTVGKFDGVHRGHRAVLDELKRVASARGLGTAVVTFDRNPLEVVAPAKCPEAVVSMSQKLELLESTGVDAVLVLRFDAERAAQPPHEFVREVLVDALRARVVLIGGDFRFGAKGAGDSALLREDGAREGFDVHPIDDVGGGESGRISSSMVRAALGAGDVQRAAHLLGRPHAVRGVVVHGAERGRALGFPTANLAPDAEGMVPADGVYAGFVVDGDHRYPAAISVGDNPTFDGVPARQVEAYVIDEDLDLYDHVIDVQFVERIRGMVAFRGVDALIEQMTDDVERASALLAAQRGRA
jgi:riboflavin kinase/FMN adenylyltransferase